MSFIFPLLYRFLMGEVAGAKEDLLESVKIIPSSTYSLVKIASVHMEEGDPKQAFECFEEAIKQNPNDPDIYYHRGQGLHSSFSSSESAHSDDFHSFFHHERIRKSG
jgi:mitochondrial import receptor subunit TOM70